MTPLEAAIWFLLGLLGAGLTPVVSWWLCLALKYRCWGEAVPLGISVLLGFFTVTMAVLHLMELVA